MESIEHVSHVTTKDSACHDRVEIASLVAAIYEIIPPSEQSQLLGQLLRPLGILSLVGVANGIFAKLWFRSGQQIFHIRPDDAHNIQSSDIFALVDFVQQVSVETVDGIAAMLSTSPALMGSAAAALLLTLLIKRSRPIK